MYDNGRGVPKDYAAAVKWFRLAAGREHTSTLLAPERALGQVNLGVMYNNGEDVPSHRKC